MPFVLRRKILRARPKWRPSGSRKGCICYRGRGISRGSRFAPGSARNREAVFRKRREVPTAVTRMSSSSALAQRFRALQYGDSKTGRADRQLERKECRRSINHACESWITPQAPRDDCERHGFQGNLASILTTVAACATESIEKSGGIAQVFNARFGDAGRRESEERGHAESGPAKDGHVLLC